MDEVTYQAHRAHCVNIGHASETLIRWRKDYHNDFINGHGDYSVYCDGAEDALDYAISRIQAVMLEDWHPDYMRVESIEDITRRVYHVCNDIARRCIKRERCYDLDPYFRGYVDASKFALRLIGNWLL